MDSLGVYEPAGGDTPNAYITWGSASPSDLVELNGRASLSNLNQRFALFSMDSDAAKRWWDDHEGDGGEGGSPIQLVVETVPEPASWY